MPHIPEGAWAAIGAAFGAVALWLTNRLVGRAAWQNALNSGFSDLAKAQAARLEDVETELKALREERRVGMAQARAERLQLHGEIVQLRQVIQGLRRVLREHNIDVAEVPDEPPGMFVTLTTASEG